MAATVVFLGGAANTTSGTHTVTATPALGDLIVIATFSTGNTSNAVPTDDQAGGATYSEVTAAACVKASSADQMRVFVRSNLIQSAISTIFTHAPGASTGGGLAVYAIRGLARTGQNAVRQAAKQDNQTAATTPTPVLSAAALTANCLIGGVFNATSPAGMTPRSSPAWTEDSDTGYSTPTTGEEMMHINSGETASSIAWGSTSASIFCAFVVEFDCSAEVPAEFNAPPMVPAHR